MGTFNTGKGDLSITAIYDSGCDDNYSYDDEEWLYDDIKMELEEIPENYNKKFSYDFYYVLDEIFNIQIKGGYYDGFYVYIDSIFSIDYMMKKIEMGLYKPNVNIKELDNEDVKMETFFKYIAEKVFETGYDLLNQELSKKEFKNVKKAIVAEIKDYYNYLNYNMVRVCRNYGMYNLIENWWVRKIKPLDDNIVNELKNKIA